MIKVNEAKSVSIEIGDNDYRIDSAEEYRNFLIVLTDPNPSISFGTDDFAIDASIKDPDSIAIAERYRDFLTAFIEQREKVLEEAAAEINAGVAASEAALAFEDNDSSFDVADVDEDESSSDNESQGS